MVMVCALSVGVIALFPAAMTSIAHAGIPDHEIRYENTLAPAWKDSWDLARKLYREKRLSEALAQYEILLAQKENVGQARWEYVSLLIDLQHWPQASRHLEVLLAQDSENFLYQLAAARVFLASGKAATATAQYRKLYDSAPTGRESMQLLAGLVSALEASGPSDELLPLVEKLVLANPQDSGLLGKYAGLLLDAGRTDEAGKIIDRLGQNGQAGAWLADLRLRLQARLGYRSGTVRSPRKIDGKDGGNPAASLEVPAYAAEPHELTARLQHVETGLRARPGDPVLLEQAADLNILLGRIGSALEYYDACLIVHPGDEKLLKKKSEAQAIMAQELLPLVENGGCQKLWLDLARMTSDRAGVFRQMAALLRQRDRAEELAEVLAILCREDPGDLPAYQELAQLLAKSGRGDELESLQRQIERE